MTDPFRAAWLDHQAKFAPECRREPSSADLSAWGAQLYEACKRLDSGERVPSDGPDEWQEYAMFVQVIAGGPLGTVG